MASKSRETAGNCTREQARDLGLHGSLATAIATASYRLSASTSTPWRMPSESVKETRPVNLPCPEYPPNILHLFALR